VAFVYTLFGTAITRSWELIGLEGGGPLDLLARRLGAREPLNSEPAEQDPEPGPGGGGGGGGGGGWGGGGGGGV
jgi:hypothetical protein